MLRIRRMLAHGDRGFTLIEMIVAITLFAIFVTVALATVVRLTTSTVTAQQRALGSSDALIIFQNLDRQVRYASSINYPGISNGKAYVEFLTSASVAPSGLDTCTQWRYDPSTGVMQMRQWTAATVPVYGTWQTKGTDLKNAASSTVPFRLIPAAATVSSFQRLALHLDIGGPKLSDQTSVDTTFLARNSSLSSPSNADSNSDGVSDNPVCAPAGYRP